MEPYSARRCQNLPFSPGHRNSKAFWDECPFDSEKDSPSKPSVAELAGRFKGHVLPMPNSNDERLIRRRPPCSLKLNSPKDDDDDKKSLKPSIPSPKPFKMKIKSSPIIEKLQANLALSPTSLLPSPKSPEVKLQPPPLSPASPCSPCSPTRQTSEAEPISFESPPEGVPLPSIIKSRARLSFKRRPPTRQHRRSAGEEPGATGDNLSPCELNSPKENGDEKPVINSPTEEQKNERGSSTAGLAGQKEFEDRDLVADDPAASRAEPASQEGQTIAETEAEQAQTLESSAEEQRNSGSCPTEPIRGGSNMDDEQEEANPEEENERL